STGLTSRGSQVRALFRLPLICFWRLKNFDVATKKMGIEWVCGVGS
ncbi:uncharacterized protein METZ01_LOCUS251437, partial [marine metagenome]